MGLLGDSFDDPRTQQILGLAAGLLSANGSQGLSAGILGMSNAQDAMLKRQDILQQIKLRDLQAQQQQRMFDLQSPFLAEAARRMQAQSAPATPGGNNAPVPGDAYMPGAQPSQQSQSAAPQAASMFPGIPDSVAFGMIGAGGFSDLPKTISDYNKPTDFSKALQAAGIDPNSAIGRQLAQVQLAKLNYQAPVNARPGSILRDPFTAQPIAFNPHVPEGASPVFDASGNVTAFNTINGALPAIAAAETAKTSGVAEATPSIGYDAAGKPIYSTRGQDLRRAAGGVSQPSPPAQPGVSGAFDLSDPTLLAAIRDMKNPQEQANAFAALQTQLAGGGGRAPLPGAVTPVPQLGAQTGANLSQDELSAKGKSLMADNGQTNTVISRLQNIKMLAPGAITGAEANRRDFFNGLLSLAGIQGASDAKTASDLVDKNQAQIVSALRMGQGGAGTDALQTLLGAANPNRHMSNDAVQEAADQLIASQKMIQAKAQLLQPHYLGRDPVSYGTKELQFDQSADPRLWQLQAMPPQQQAAYVKTLPPAVAADMLQKRQALKQLGVLQ